MSKSRKEALMKEDERAHSAPEVRGSVCFDVDFGHERKTKSAKRPPVKLKTEKKQKSTLVDYTDDETLMIAEIMREAHLEEKKNKARVDMKLFDASRRRMCSNYLKEQNAERKAEMTRSVPDISERRRRVKEMAAASRKQATTESLTASETGKS